MIMEPAIVCGHCHTVEKCMCLRVGDKGSDQGSVLLLSDLIKSLTKKYDP